MVDLEQAEALRRPGRLLHLAVPGREYAGVRRPVDERMAGLAVGVDRRPAEGAVLTAVEGDRLDRRPRAAARRLAERRIDVVDREGDVLHPVAVLPDVLGDLAVGGQGRGKHERDVVAAHHVARPVADAGLEAGERDRREAPESPVISRGLAGVADPELDVVDALEGQEVLGLGEGVLVQPGAGLVGGTAGHRVGHLVRSPCAVEFAPGGSGEWLWLPMLRPPCDTGPVDDPDDLRGLAERLVAGRAALTAVRPAIEAGEPWPLSAAYGTEPESDWGPKEVLAHVAEMIPYWLRQADQVLRAPAESGPTPFGRVASDPHRIERIGADRNLAAAALFDSIDEGLAAAIQRVETTPSGRRHAAGQPPAARRHDRRGIARTVPRRPSRRACPQPGDDGRRALSAPSIGRRAPLRAQTAPIRGGACRHLRTTWQAVPVLMGHSGMGPTAGTVGDLRENTSPELREGTS